MIFSAKTLTDRTAFGSRQSVKEGGSCDLQGDEGCDVDVH